MYFADLSKIFLNYRKYVLDGALLLDKSVK